MSIYESRHNLWVNQDVDRATKQILVDLIIGQVHTPKLRDNHLKMPNILARGQQCPKANSNSII